MTSSLWSFLEEDFPRLNQFVTTVRYIESMFNVHIQYGSKVKKIVQKWKSPSCVHSKTCGYPHSVLAKSSTNLYSSQYTDFFVVNYVLRIYENEVCVGHRKWNWIAVQLMSYTFLKPAVPMLLHSALLFYTRPWVNKTKLPWHLHDNRVFDFLGARNVPIWSDRSRLVLSHCTVFLQNGPLPYIRFKGTMGEVMYKGSIG